MPVAQGPEGRDAWRAPALFCYRLLKPPLFTRVRGETVRKVPEVPETGPHEASQRLVRPCFRPIRRPNPRSESRSNPFSDGLGRSILGSCSGRCNPSYLTSLINWAG